MRVRIHLKPAPRLRTTEIDFDFGDIAVKGRSSKGNIVARNAVQKIIKAVPPA